MLGKINSAPIIILFLVLGLCGAIAGYYYYDWTQRTCCAPPVAIDKKKLPPIPETREECLKQKGKWDKIGLSEGEKCNLKTSDSGKTCTDSSQCEGSCLGESVSSRSGKCSSFRITVGCYFFVNEGKVEGQLCAD